MVRNYSITRARSHGWTIMPTEIHSDMWVCERSPRDLLLFRRSRRRGQVRIKDICYGFPVTIALFLPYLNEFAAICDRTLAFGIFQRHLIHACYVRQIAGA